MSIDTSCIYGKLSCAFLLASFFSFYSLFAQGSGSMKGRVLDNENGAPLVGANVVIQNTSLGTAADIDGKFYLHIVPAGKWIIKVSYIGYTPITREVTVTADAVLEQEFRLKAHALMGEEVIVTAQARGQEAAINQQIAMNTIANIVSEQRIQELPDFNAAEALGRLPGVSTQRSSGEGNKIVIRGLSPQYNLIAVNGVQLGSTNNSDRSVDLSMITPNMIRTIEVYKAITPDMDGDAIGGYVNMKLREAPEGVHTDLMWQSGYTKYKNQYGNYKAVGQVSDRFFNNDFGVFILGNVERFDRSADNYNGSYNTRGDDPIPPGEIYRPVYFQQMGLNRHLEDRHRYGANIMLDYALPKGKIMQVNFFSRMNQDYTDYTTQYNVANTRMQYTLSKGITNTDVMTNGLQGENDFGFVVADFNVSNSYSRNYNPSNVHTFNFWQEASSNLGAYTNMKNPQPEVIAQGATPYIDDQGSQLGTYLYSLGESYLSYKEMSQTYTLNLQFPYVLGQSASGFFKVGGKYVHTTRDNDQGAIGPGGPGGNGVQVYYGGQRFMEDEISNNFPLLRLNPATHIFYASNFTNPDPSTWQDFLGNRFGDLIWAPDIAKLDPIIAKFDELEQTDSTFRSRAFWASGPVQNLSLDYNFVEKQSAGYAMTEIDLGPALMLLGGARYENVDRSFTAYQMKDGGDNTGYANVTQLYKKVTVPGNDHYVLPMVHLRYKATSWMDVRYAFTKTLSRPPFYAFSPKVFINQAGNTVTAGNPDLKPAQSQNHDFIFSLYTNYVGLLTIGGFYKTVRDFVWYTQYNLQTDTVPGLKNASDFPLASAQAQLTTYLNNPNKAFIKGLELDWQTHFWYLPFPFDGIVLNVNYTHAWSSTVYPSELVKQTRIPIRPFIKYFLVDTLKGGRLQDQPSDLVNASVGYDYKKFSGRVSFSYTSSTVRNVTARDESDSETKEFFRIDATIKQGLPWPGLQLFLNLNNINNRKDEQAQKTINAPTLQQYYGFTAELGIQFKLE